VIVYLAIATSASTDNTRCCPIWALEGLAPLASAISARMGKVGTTGRSWRHSEAETV
jgi:hypothetical protein